MITSYSSKWITLLLLLHQGSIGFMLWLVWLWFNTDKAWPGRPGNAPENGGLWKHYTGKNFFTQFFMANLWICWVNFGPYHPRGNTDDEGGTFISALVPDICNPYFISCLRSDAIEKQAWQSLGEHCFLAVLMCQCSHAYLGKHLLAYFLHHRLTHTFFF